MADARSHPIKQTIRERALGQGFDAVGFAAPEVGERAKAELAEFLARGLHGDMGWLAANAARRAEPRALWPAARSVIVLGVNYTPREESLGALGHRGRGAISVYARGRDYHAVLKTRLKALARWIHESFACDVKPFVDTAPVMEKPLGALGGIGWQGKHTNMVSRSHGSWLFLGEVFTTLDLPADAPEADHCGSCRACLDICPTDAFPAPYRIDARRCISYLTIEHKGHIAPEFRRAMGNRIYGCDDCLAACPWNKFARAAQGPDFLPCCELTAPRLADLARLDEAAFREVFAGTAIKRTGRDRFVRNVLIALGNSGDRSQAPVARELLGDPSPLVRAMAVWALSQLSGPAAFAALRAAYLPREHDSAVRKEWKAGAAQGAPQALSANS